MTPERTLARFLPRFASANDRGFVLIGVVMFVLALTILGLSLFSLSSYEGQFFSRSYASDQALYTAQSGIEHVKFLLAKRDSMALASSTLFPQMVFPQGVVYARAMRAGTSDSVHSVSRFPPGTAITIRVMASVGGERRMVESSYVPFQTPNLYKRLMSIHNSLYVKPTKSDKEPPVHEAYWLCDQTHLDGVIWAGGALDDSSCATNVNVGPVPIPDVPTFFSNHLAAAQPVDGGGVAQFNLLGPKNQPTYYEAASDGLDPTHYTVHTPVNVPVRISVSGYAVLLVPHGIRFEDRVELSGQSDDCLVIVAEPGTDQNPDFNGRGIWFFASLYFSSAQFPVILVSNGVVQLEHFYAQDLSTYASYLSVFAGDGWFGGPGPGSEMVLQHGSAADDLIDKLCDAEALPNSETGSVKFQPVAGTWKELDPDHPTSP